jgi:NitT/TauT family transport system substrate-binding protein
MADSPRFTFLGKLISLALIGGLVYFGFQMVRGKGVQIPGFPSGTPKAENQPKAAEVSEVQAEVPTLAPAAAFELKADSIVPIEISEYAGYAGLIAANGGLDPSPASLFTKYCGCKVKLTISEEESWSALNSGKLAGSVTTTDVLAVYGRQFKVKVPAQIGYSRGADGLVVRNDIRRVNALRGKVVAAAQFTETDFFIRYLAQEAGIGLATLGSLDAAPNPDRINLVYTDDGFAAGDLFLSDVNGAGKLSGAVTWEPKTSEVLAQSNGKTRLLTSNRNLLIIADIVVLNQGFAEQHPRMVEGIVRGLLEGNRLVRDNPDAQVDLVGRAFKWTPEQTRAELAKVHLANLPENLAFFNGSIDAAGSFGGIFQSAVYAYGSDLIKDPADPSRFVDPSALQAAEKSGAFKDQKIAIAPIKSGAAGTVENDPLLSKDIRFLFQPNSSVLDQTQPDNLKNLAAIKQLLVVSPGSTILLRGHVDNSLIEDFRKKGGEAFVRQMALKAVELSRARAAEIQRLLVEKYSVDGKRLEIVGRGWDEPAGPDPEQNRRVEVQWFTLE